MQLSMENKCVGVSSGETATATIKTNVNINSATVIINKYSHGESGVVFVIEDGNITLEQKELKYSLDFDDHTINLSIPEFATGDGGIFLVDLLYKENTDVIPVVFHIEAGTLSHFHNLLNDLPYFHISHFYMLINIVVVCRLLL